MLNELKITNFAIAESLDIEFQTGFSAITGETGAGKSIMIDALALALGARADSAMVGSKGDKAQIIADFDISNNEGAQRWLEEKSLDTDGECILRRVLGKDGKSRAFINGMPSPLQDIKSLAEQLINIHSQHQHQQLLKKESHRELLDAFCAHQSLVKNTVDCFKQWQATQKQLKELEGNQSTRLARIEFLEFQLDELDKLALEENEYQYLSDEHQKLANIDQDLLQANEALNLLSDAESMSIRDALYKTQQIFQQLSQKHLALRPNLESIDAAIIQIEESSRDLAHYLEHLENDPERLSEIDERLSKTHQLARKHHIKAEELYAFHQKLQEELDSLKNSDVSLSHLSKQSQTLQEQYVKQANTLSKKRKQAAKQLEQAINGKFHELGMEHAKIIVELRTLDISEASAFGLDDIELLISTNPGQPAQSLHKIASGGELSRISLAIQVNFAEKASLPCLIFDEVDVGIGGATAEVVGRLLRQLSRHSQIICVTHLAQVAAHAHQQFKIHKHSDASKTVTQVFKLKQKERVEEIARMMSGAELTQKSQSHARELLSLAQ